MKMRKLVNNSANWHDHMASRSSGTNGSETCSSRPPTPGRGHDVKRGTMELIVPSKRDHYRGKATRADLRIPSCLLVGDRWLRHNCGGPVWSRQKLSYDPRHTTTAPLLLQRAILVEQWCWRHVVSHP